MLKNEKTAFSIEKCDLILYVNMKPMKTNTFRNAAHILERHQFFLLIKTKLVLKINNLYVITFLITSASE